MPEKQFELQFDGDRRRGYVKEGENRFSFEELCSQYDDDSTVAADSKAVIASRVLGGRWFSQEWDAHYGNPPDPVLL